MNALSPAYYRDLVLVLLGKDFKVRYKSTVLGYAWSVLHPLLFAAVFFVVFSKLLRVKTDPYPYALFLIAGLFPWQWFSNSVNASNYFFLGNSSLIKKVRFPREFLVLSGVLGDCIHFVISIPVIVVFMVAYGYYPSLSWLWQLPLLVAVQFLITQGLALMVATMNLYFRDLERLTGLVVMLWFYLTPVIYPTKFLVEQGYGWALYANPLASLVVCWQRVFLDGVLPTDLLAVASLFGVVVFLAGHRLYRRLEWRFAEIV
jgi:lipopolysaccharide transport system permease protein